MRGNAKEVHVIHERTTQGLRLNLKISQGVNDAIAQAEKVIVGAGYSLSIRDGGEISFVIYNEDRTECAHVPITKTDLKKIVRGHKQMSLSVRLMYREA